MPHRLLACLTLLLIAPTTLAERAPPADDPTQLETIEVAGEMPGPGLWRVSHGEHVLWLVGTLSPVPSKVEWRSAELEQRLAEAEAIVGSPGMNLKTGVGRFGSLMLLPSILGARKNPDRARLQDVLPAELYLRWAELKPTYLGRDRAVERWRPIFAAQKLHHKAVDRAGLRFGSPAADLVREQAKARQLPTIASIVEWTIDDPRVAIREFKATTLDDTECFERTMQRLESDLDLLRARAAAWATGDLTTLRALREADPASACISSLLSISTLQKRGVADVPARLEAAWLAAAEQALGEHRVSVGVLPIAELLKADGYLAELAARGYQVLAPDEDELDEAGEAALVELAMPRLRD
jgi:hypothetical protein